MSELQHRNECFATQRQNKLIEREKISLHIRIFVLFCAEIWIFSVVLWKLIILICCIVLIILYMIE